jgi:hypothetical protein
LEEPPEAESHSKLIGMMKGLSLMSPAFTGYHYSKDREKLVAKASVLGLTTIIEELEELNLLSTAKKVKDDASLVDRSVPTLIEQPSLTPAINTIVKRLDAQFEATIINDTAPYQGM